MFLQISLFLTICLQYVNLQVVLPTRGSKNLRVMTFNVFMQGSQVYGGLPKIAKHIKSINPDIVGLQEINNQKTDEILQFLGPEWYRCSDPGNRYPYLDVTLITRHPFVSLDKIDGFSNIGCRLSLGGASVVDVWNHHLLYTNYGPYTACFTASDDVSSRLHSLESYSPFNNLDSRAESARKFIEYDSKILDANLTVLLGDFNVPSHLDWTSSTKNLHCGVEFEWPVSKMLEQYGYLDSFRVAKWVLLWE